MRLKNQNVNEDGSLRLKYVGAEEEEPKKEPKKKVSRKKKGEK